MQLAVASHDGDDELRPLVRRLWSAERGASLIPADMQPEIEGCVQDLLSLLREPPPDRSEQLRAVAARVEDVFVTLALLGPPAAS
jgi:hypothetical protein